MTGGSLAHGPLAGVRIIEMDAIGPVPLAGMVLAGMGADVVQVGRPTPGVWDDIGGAVLHRGKTRITLSLRDTTDRDTLLRLVAGADALIEGSRPGAMERLGIGPEVCHGRNRALVYVRLTGWGQTGPLAPTAGHDINYIAMTGALHAFGEADGMPTAPLNLVGDYAGGTMFAVSGLLAALHHARQTGQGQVVDAAMVDGVANMLSMYHAFLAGGNWRDRRGSNFLDGGAPYYRCYECKDGRHVAVGALEPQFFAVLVRMLGLESRGFAQQDEAGWPAMGAAFASRFRERSRDEWEALFAGSEACVSPVLSMSEAIDHPANRARGTFIERGGIQQANPAPRFSQGAGLHEQDASRDIEDVIARWT